jgi:hypothetical protein
MTLACGCEGELYVELPDDTTPCNGTLICPECRKLIHKGQPHYRAWTWGVDENGDEFVRDIREVCEACGDLAQALLERGFCWYWGELRADVRALHELETGEK